MRHQQDLFQGFNPKMLIQKKNQLFLEKFKLEVVKAIIRKKQALITEQAEDKRIKKEIEVHKLRKKFSLDQPKPPLPPLKPSEKSPLPPLAPTKPLPPLSPKKPLPPIASTPTPARTAIIQTPRKPMPPVAQPIKPMATPPATPAPKRGFIQKIIPKKRKVVKPPETINYGKVAPYIRDPTITAVECQGPDKNVIIKKAGSVLTTNVKLSKEEINTIIKSFSAKARIPIIEGMLKARVKDVTISAVISDMTGARFIITKTLFPPLRTPTRLQNPNMPAKMPPLNPNSTKRPMMKRPGMPRPNMRR